MQFDTYTDFLTYILVHTANIDGTISDEEVKMVRSISGIEKPREIYKFYKQHSDEEREIYLEGMKEKHNLDEDKKSEILEKVREVMASDFVFEKEEKDLYRSLKDFLYK